jgi:hypothetical protein
MSVGATFRVARCRQQSVAAVGAGIGQILSGQLLRSWLRATIKDAPTGFSTTLKVAPTASMGRTLMGYVVLSPGVFTEYNNSTCLRNCEQSKEMQNGSYD